MLPLFSLSIDISLDRVIRRAGAKKRSSTIRLLRRQRAALKEPFGGSATAGANRVDNACICHGQQPRRQGLA
jgi:hypothetical protein